MSKMEGKMILSTSHSHCSFRESLCSYITVASHSELPEVSTMLEAQRLTNKCGQSITIFNNDQQLYRVAVNATWVYPDLFTNFVP